MKNITTLRETTSVPHQRHEVLDPLYRKDLAWIQGLKKDGTKNQRKTRWGVSGFLELRGLPSRERPWDISIIMVLGVSHNLSKAHGKKIQVETIKKRAARNFMSERFHELRPVVVESLLLLLEGDSVRCMGSRKLKIFHKAQDGH